MWWIILVIIAIVLIKFAHDYSKQAQTVSKQGGMRVKYKTLVNYFLAGDPDSKIIQETPTFISVGVSSISGSTTFFITHSFGWVNIQYRLNSRVFGNHKLEWEFDEFGDQNKMIEKIEHDISIYNKNMLQKYM